MARPVVFITRSYHEQAILFLETHCDVEVWPVNATPPRYILKDAVRERDGMLTEAVDQIDADILDSARALKVIANRAVGTDNLDIPTATRKGILVSNTPGILQETCADMAFALMLDAARKVSYADRLVRSGLWTSFDQTPYLGLDVHGKTLGIVGMGGIAQGVARRARGFDMKVLYWSRTRKEALEDRLGLAWAPTLHDLLDRSDFVSLHVPLTGETRGLIGKKEFTRMRQNAILINTSRGPVVDPGALYEALSLGMIAGAGIDVSSPEPLPQNDPLIALPNIVITPHIASASRATFEAMAMLAAQNIVAALTGQPMPSCLNPEAAARR